ncbi:MAG: sulfotransferase [Porticoccus sp.]
MSPSDDFSSWRALYVCSAARCGSTFTDMFLGGHSKAASLGEVNFLGKAVALQQKCSCGAGICECPYWDCVFDELREVTSYDFRSQPYAYRLWDGLAYNVIDHRKQTYRYKLAVRLRKAWLELRYRCGDMLPLLSAQVGALRNKALLYESVANQWNKNLIIDSSKNAREAVELNKLMPGRVKVLVITRDGRGVFHSRRKSQVSQRQSLLGWMNYYRRALPLLEKSVHDGDLLVLRYEDLATNPLLVGKKLCDFAGVEFENSMLDLGAVTRHLVNGNDSRFSAGKGIQLDERWKTELSRNELDFFVKFGGEELNRRLGYR